MKEKTFLILWLLFLGILVSPSAWGQYFNYASAYTGNQTTDYQSLIRKIDDTSALVCFYDDSVNQYAIARVGLSLSCRKAILPMGCTVNDMRITGDDVYFCGSLYATPIIGHIKLSSFWTPNRTFTLFKVTNSFATNLHRMAAYTIDGKQKVVIVGDVIFTDNSPFSCPYDTTYYDPSLGDSVHYYYHYCLHTIILEVDFIGANHLLDRYVSTTIVPSHRELITEVIETENYVAFVGHYTDHHTTIIHRCPKNDVLNNFDGYHWCFWGIDEGHSRFRGCLMKGDTIAVSSMSTFYDSYGVQQFSTNIRVFDIASTNVTNTHALRVPLNTKTEPLDLMYMPKDHRLVLLQDIKLPSLSSDQNTFVHIDPYMVTAHNAKCWYEAYWQKSFNCLCRLNDTIYLASGGEYWCMKDIDPLISDSCYKTDVVNVIPINKEHFASELDRYYKNSDIVDSLSLFSLPKNAEIESFCIINN